MFGCPARQEGACPEGWGETPSHSTLQALLKLRIWGFGTPGASITFLLLLGVGLRRREKERQTLGKGQGQRREDQARPVCLSKATGKLTGSSPLPPAKPVALPILDPTWLPGFLSTRPFIRPCIAHAVPSAWNMSPFLLSL